MWQILNSSPQLPKLVNENEALLGRQEPLDPGKQHAVFKEPLKQYDGYQSLEIGRVLFGMGCFWGAERLFWSHPGVLSTSVGYAGGYTTHPTYQEVCSGRTGHSEVVQVYFNRQTTSLSSLLKLFWERHDPTQGMRQGNDIGTQYRSVIYWSDLTDEALIRESASLYQALLNAGEAPLAMGNQVTTELGLAPTFYYAEEYHQQYLDKNPNGYCGLKGTGVTCSL